MSYFLLFVPGQSVIKENANTLARKGTNATYCPRKVPEKETEVKLKKAQITAVYRTLEGYAQMIVKKLKHCKTYTLERLHNNSAATAVFVQIGKIFDHGQQALIDIEAI